MGKHIIFFFLKKYWTKLVREVAIMFAKINRIMRIVLLAAGALFFVFKLTEKNKIEKKSEKDGFQTKEFDDIW